MFFFLGPPGAENAFVWLALITTVCWGVERGDSSAVETAEAEAEAPAGETTVVAAPPPGPATGPDEAASSSAVTSERPPRAGESLPDVLSALPGTSVTRLGGQGAFATVSLRGSASNQVQVVVDGVPVTPAAGGVVDMSTLPLGDVERIDVYRGMTPIAFAEASPGGVVSIETRRPQGDAAEVAVGGGSFGTWSLGAQVQGVTARGPSVLAGAHLLRSQGDFLYVNDRGTTFPGGGADDTATRRRNNALRQGDGALRVDLPTPSRHEVWLSLSALARQQGLAGDGKTPTERASLGSTRLVGVAAWDARGVLAGAGRLRVRAFGAGLEQRLSDPDGEVGQVPHETRDRTFTGGASVLVERPFFERVRVAWVGETRAERWQPWQADDEMGAAASRSLVATGLETAVFWERLGLSLIPAVRVLAAADTTSGRDGAYKLAPAGSASGRALPSARLAVLKRMGETAGLRANVARYARLPTFTELYADTGYLLGTPSLAPETGINADAGVRWTVAAGRARLTTDAAIFAAWSRDLIALVINARSVGRYENVSRAETRGAELAFDGRWGEHARLVASGTLTDARDASGRPAYDGKRLPSRPLGRAYLRPEARALSLGRAFRLGVFADVDLTAGNQLDPAGTVRVPARALIGAGVWLDGLPAHTRLVVSGQNLADVRVVDVAGYPLPSRALFASLIVTTKEPSP